jgi:hypothetical protein
MKENRTIYGKAWSIKMAISPTSFSGRLQHKHDMEKERAFPQLRSSNPSRIKIDQRASRPMLRTAFHQAVVEAESSPVPCLPRNLGQSNAACRWNGQSQGAEPPQDRSRWRPQQVKLAT